MKIIIDIDEKMTKEAIQDYLAEIQIDYGLIKSIKFEGD